MMQQTKIVFCGIKASPQKMRRFAKEFAGVKAVDVLELLEPNTQKRATILGRVVSNALNILVQKKMFRPSIRLNNIIVDKAASRRVPSARAKGRVNFLEKQSCRMTLTFN